MTTKFEAFRAELIAHRSRCQRIRGYKHQNMVRYAQQHLGWTGLPPMHVVQNWVINAQLGRGRHTPEELHHLRHLLWMNGRGFDGDHLVSAWYSRVYWQRTGLRDDITAKAA